MDSDSASKQECPAMRRLSRARAAIGLISLLVFSTGAGPSRAADQADKPPVKGGFTYSLGMPSVYKPYMGFELQAYRPGEQGDLGGLLSFGIDKDLGNPIVGAGAIGLEGYGGYRGQELDGGGRAIFSIPSFLLGAGVDYNITDDEFDFLIRMGLTTRRGGIFGAGSVVAIRYMPTRDHSFSVGISVPLWGKHLGRSRAKQDHVVMDDRQPERMEIADDELPPRLVEALADLGERVSWVTRMTQPFAEDRGADPGAVMDPVTAEIGSHIAEIDDRFPDGHTALEEIRVYHETIELAFALALSDGAEPTTAQLKFAREIADVARESLLKEVLLPYNRLIGQYKKHDSLLGMVSVAQTRFGRLLLTQTELPDREVRELWLVFQTLCDYIEAERKEAAKRWEDSRFVWLPLQLALMSDQHDSQAEIDALIEAAVEEPFTHENRIWYVVNESFQWEMARTVRLARDYHVLWIHDYRGVNANGEPDRMALAHTVNYLEAMIDRVRDYDETGKFPSYLIVIDQVYFEINKGRKFLKLLEDPLGHSIDLPDEYEEWSTRIDETQQRLRDAIEDSQLLALERSQYGEDWLKNYIKVHVTVTNQADPSFISLNIAGIIPIPDNNMRDHRKIAFYDITEEDPYRGVAMFTGMGIGEHYAGANWEDRAIMIQGPGALGVKTAARELLETQGFEKEQIPYVLRALPRAADYDEKIKAEHEDRTPDWIERRGSVLQLHNETGFFDKPVEVSKAILYSLMPPGSVLQIPDSLWQNYLYASLMAGSSLRGCRVLVISPAMEHAPAGGAANMARAHDLMARLIVFQNALAEEIEDAGGLLAVGLYAPKQDVGDIAGRFRQAMENHPSWLRRVFPGRLSNGTFLDDLDVVLEDVGYLNPHAIDESGVEKPKLHLKANFFASGTGWEKLMTRPELGHLVLEHSRYLAEQAMVEANATTVDLPDVRSAPASLMKAWLDLVEGLLVESTPEEREKLIYYFTVGSVNLDYRSMVLNAETMVLVSGWQSLTGFVDFLLLPGLCEWVDTTEELDALLPDPSWNRRWISNFLRILL
jgi:hypothetical protein